MMVVASYRPGPLITGRLAYLQSHQNREKLLLEAAQMLNILLLHLIANVSDKLLLPYSKSIFTYLLKT